MFGLNRHACRGRTPMRLVTVAGLLALGAAATVAPAAAEGPPLDLEGYRLTFAEEFDELPDVSPWGPGTRWIAHTPWAGDFGDARFVDPRPGFPFTIEDGVLVITAARTLEGRWESGLLASADPQNQGFLQTYGYFEARMRLPPGPGVWPAFWLMGRSDDRSFAAEIDVLEYLGQFPGGYGTYVHTWYNDGEREHEVISERHRPDADLTGAFHTYGVLVDETDITFYFNRQPIWQTPTPEAHRIPKMVLVNLALGSGYPIDETFDPSHLYVDYIRVYEECPSGGC